jgi:hypothetical protein
MKKLAATLMCWITGTLIQHAAIVQYDFSIVGDSGYYALGRLAYEATTAPPSISYVSGFGSGLDSLTVSFYDPSSSLLGTSFDVIGGTVTYGMLSLNFNTLAPSFSGVFDFGQDNGNPGEYYWGGLVGSSSELWSSYSDTQLDGALPTVINVTAVPEPVGCAIAMGLGLLGFAAYRRRRAT